MKRQYSEIKSNYKDCLLFFRLGDFYEMFDEDAKTASKELTLRSQQETGASKTRMSVRLCAECRIIRVRHT
jgi:DNA mismatch repair ATPase MutS